jgi:NADPH:quinone reductase
MIRTGRSQWPAGSRSAPHDGGCPVGGEIFGAVVAVGEGVPGSWIGQAVGGVVFEGVYADYVLAAPALVTEIPAGIDSADALAVVRGGLVAMGALRAGRFEKGESALVTAAAGGSGHLAIQIARALGAARVVAAVGSFDKAEFVRECGADAVVGYDGPWGDPVDVALDGVGGELVRRGRGNPLRRTAAWWATVRAATRWTRAACSRN